MKDTKFSILNTCQMKKIKGGIIVEHLLTYDGLLTESFQNENVHENIEQNENIELNTASHNEVVEKTKPKNDLL